MSHTSFVGHASKPKFEKLSPA